MWIPGDFLWAGEGNDDEPRVFGGFCSNKGSGFLDAKCEAHLKAILSSLYSMHRAQACEIRMPWYQASSGSHISRLLKIWQWAEYSGVNSVHSQASSTL